MMNSEDQRTGTKSFEILSFFFPHVRTTRPYVHASLSYSLLVVILRVFLEQKII